MDRPGITRTVGIVNLLTLGDMSRYVYGGTMPQQFEIELQRFRCGPENNDRFPS